MYTGGADDLLAGIDDVRINGAFHWTTWRRVTFLELENAATFGAWGFERSAGDYNPTHGRSQGTERWEA